MQIRCLQTVFRVPSVRVGESEYPLKRNALGHLILDVPSERDQAQLLARADTFVVYDEDAEALKAAAAAGSPELEPAVPTMEEDDIDALRAKEEALQEQARRDAERDAARKAAQSAAAAAEAPKRSTRGRAVGVKVPDKTPTETPPSAQGSTADNANQNAEQQADANQQTDQPSGNDAAADQQQSENDDNSSGSGLKFLPPAENE